MARPVGGRAGSSLRIAGGAFRGRRLAVASGVRPSGARVREALFSIWQTRVEGCRFLDLFAGSGAVGIEAISRGARGAVLVEGSPRVCETLRRNAHELAGTAARVDRARLPAGLERMGSERFDLIFADPPYAFSGHGALLHGARTRLSPGGEMAIEHPAGIDLGVAEGRWLCHDRRRYGDACLSFFHLNGDSEAAG